MQKLSCITFNTSHQLINIIYNNYNYHSCWEYYFRVNSMDLLALKYFYTVASEGGFTKASQKLNIGQPGISKMVQKLEEDLGVLLLERQKKKIILTKAGLEIYEKCKVIFNQVEGIEQVSKTETSTCHGPLQFGATESIASHLIPNILTKYLASYPQVTPRCYCSTASEIIDKIEKGELEFGLMFYTPELPRMLTEDKLQKLDFKVVVAKDFKKNKSTLDRFIGSREIDAPSTVTLPTFDKLKKNNPNLNIAISTNSITAHKNLVLSGVGISILPYFLVKDEIENKKIVTLLSDEKFSFSLKIVYRKNRVLSRNAVKFIEAVKQMK